MEPIIIAIARFFEVLAAEGGAGIVTAFKAVGVLAAFDWMRENPKITLGALAVGVYLSVTAYRSKA
jgi:hypothetical protein